MTAHRSTEELNAAIGLIDEAPTDRGRLEAIVARPSVGERRELTTAELSTAEGLVGDSWAQRPSRFTDDGSPEPARQLTLMSSRAVAAMAERSDWALAGDQLFVDLDLGTANLPTGALVEIGSAVLSVSAEPHRGCAKFQARFGVDAARWVNSPQHAERRLRGINAAVVTEGRIAVGDEVRVCRPT
jgi:hypothetical protein